MEMKKCKLSEYLDSFGDGIHGTPKYDEYGDYYFIEAIYKLKGFTTLFW